MLGSNLGCLIALYGLPSSVLGRLAATSGLLDSGLLWPSPQPPDGAAFYTCVLQPCYISRGCLCSPEVELSLQVTCFLQSFAT